MVKQILATLVSLVEGNFLVMKAEPIPETCQNANQTINTGIQKLVVFPLVFSPWAMAFKMIKYLAYPLPNSSISMFLLCVSGLQ